MRVDLIETNALLEQIYPKITQMIVQNQFMPGEFISIIL